MQERSNNKKGLGKERGQEREAGGQISAAVELVGIGLTNRPDFAGMTFSRAIRREGEVIAPTTYATAGGERLRGREKIPQGFQGTTND